MSSIKEIKSIELGSYTTTMTGITVLFSIIAAILLTIIIAASVPNGINMVIYLIPTIIVGAFMIGIYNNFCQGLLYNILSKSIRTVDIALKDDKEIVKISTSETAIIVSLILTIQTFLLYCVSMFILPLLLNSMVQTLVLTGQQALALSIYQLMVVLNNPTTILIGIFSTFIISFVFVLLGTYVYNYIAGKGRGIVLNLSEENGLTAIDSLDALKFGIVFAIISLVLNIILAIILLLSGGSAVNAIGNILGGFVSGFISFYLMALFYNLLAPRIGKIKLELIDCKIN